MGKKKKRGRKERKMAFYFRVVDRSATEGIEAVELTYKGIGTEISFRPNDPELILSVDLSSDTGSLGDGSTRCVYFSWNKYEIIFETGNYYDESGFLKTTIANGYDSLLVALKEWRALYP